MKNRSLSSMTCLKCFGLSVMLSLCRCLSEGIPFLSPNSRTAYKRTKNPSSKYSPKSKYECTSPSNRKKLPLRGGIHHSPCSQPAALQLKLREDLLLEAFDGIFLQQSMSTGRNHHWIHHQRPRPQVRLTRSFLVLGKGMPFVVEVAPTTVIRF